MMYKGKEYTLTELAAMAGIKRNTLASRLWRGMSIEQALAETVKKSADRRKKYLEYKGEVRSVSEWAEILGMSKRTFRSRLRRYKGDMKLVMGKAYKANRKRQPICNMDCFKCKFKDCVNSEPQTAAEKEMLARARE